MSIFKLSLNDEIKVINFISKKNYVYITESNKLKIKGLPIIKGDCSELGKKILTTIKPLILSQQSIKFDKLYLQSLIDQEVKENISIIAQRYKIKNPESYDSKTSIQYQIAMAYGEGEHLLVPNYKIGKVGKGKKYCLVEEAKTLSYDDLCFEKVWSELQPFVK